MADTRFRGNWSPQIANPTPHKFVPVAPPARPKKKPEQDTDPEPTPDPVVEVEELASLYMCICMYVSV